MLSGWFLYCSRAVQNEFLHTNKLNFIVQQKDEQAQSRNIYSSEFAPCPASPFSRSKCSVSHYLCCSCYCICFFFSSLIHSAMCVLCREIKTGSECMCMPVRYVLRDEIVMYLDMEIAFKNTVRNPVFAFNP